MNYSEMGDDFFHLSFDFDLNFLGSRSAKGLRVQLLGKTDLREKQNVMIFLTGFYKLTLAPSTEELAQYLGNSERNMKHWIEVYPNTRKNWKSYLEMFKEWVFLRIIHQTFEYTGKTFIEPKKAREIISLYQKDPNKFDLWTLFCTIFNEQSILKFLGKLRALPLLFRAIKSIITDGLRPF